MIHSSQLLARLAAEGKLELKGEDGRKVAFHDPCYLGRHSGVFDDPRQLLRRGLGPRWWPCPAIRSGSSPCAAAEAAAGCGWRPRQEQRFSVLRVNEAAEAGAEVLATSCPYCISLLEDSQKTEGLS